MEEGTLVEEGLADWAVVEPEGPLDEGVGVEVRDGRVVACRLGRRVVDSGSRSNLRYDERV